LVFTWELLTIIPQLIFITISSKDVMALPQLKLHPYVLIYQTLPSLS